MKNLRGVGAQGLVMYSGSGCIVCKPPAKFKKIGVEIECGSFLEKLVSL